MAWQKIVDRKENQNYRGHAERCSYTFSLGPEQLPGTQWSAMQIMNAHVSELAKQDSHLLELRMWEDVSPTWQTDYYVEIVATASPLFWNVIIIGVLAVLVVIAIAFTITKIDDIAKYAPDVAKEGLSMVKWLAIAGIGVVALSVISRWRKTVS